MQYLSGTLTIDGVQANVGDANPLITPLIPDFGQYRFINFSTGAKQRAGTINGDQHPLEQMTPAQLAQAANIIVAVRNLPSTQQAIADAAAAAAAEQARQEAMQKLIDAGYPSLEEAALAALTPKLSDNVTWNATGGHFDAVTVALLVDGDTVNGERIHQGNANVIGYCDTAYAATDSVQIHWSNAAQTGIGPQQWIGLDVSFSADGGATWPVSHSTPLQNPPQGLQVLDHTPGIAFNAIKIASRADQVGADPIVTEVTINNIAN